MWRAISELRASSLTPMPCRSRPYRENWRRLRKEHLASPLHSQTLFEKTGLAASSIARRACPADHADNRVIDEIGVRTGEPGDLRRDLVHGTEPADGLAAIFLHQYLLPLT